MLSSVEPSTVPSYMEMTTRMDHLATHQDSPTSGGRSEPSTTSIIVGPQHHQTGHHPSQNVDGCGDNINNTATPATPVRIPQEPQINYSGLALVFLAPALGGFSYGYDIGATSFVLSMMLTDGGGGNDRYWWHNFPKVQQGLMVSCLALGALIGSHIVLTYLANSIGRRKEIRIAATLYIVGSMFNVMSGTLLATSNVFSHNVNFGWGLVLLLTGRLLYGVGVAFAMHSAPTYISEMAPKQVRGAMVSAKETVIVFGIAVGMLIGDLQSDYPENWTDLYAYSILFALPMLLLTFRIPRSKRWLLMKGYHDEARESMQFVYSGNIEDEFEKMADSINILCCRDRCPNMNDGNGSDTDDSDSVYSGIEDEKGGVAGVHRTGTGIQMGGNVGDAFGGPPPSLCSARYRPVMVIGMGLLVAQQFSGQPCVLAYSRVLFQTAGWQGHTSVITVTIMGFVSTFTVMMVDRLGRKTMLASGSTIMMVSLASLSFAFWDWDHAAENGLGNLKKQIVLWSMLIFICGYQVGFGPVTWTVLSEIYPTEIRGTAMALSVEVNFFAKFLTHLFFPIIQGLLGWGQTFLLLGGTVAAGLLFIIVTVPETTGMSLEEIQMHLSSRSQRTTKGGPTNNSRFGARNFVFCRHHEQQRKRQPLVDPYDVATPRSPRDVMHVV